MASLNPTDLLIPILIVIGELWLLRRLERWLHQHLFKVGWLITHSLSQTTVLYYIFFIPGVVLHEGIVFIAASLLNVRAERAIVLPETQSIAELRLNFIRLPRNVKPARAAVIALAPFVVAVFVLWLVSRSVLNIDAPIAILNAEGLSGLPAAFSTFTRTPDVWLWLYILFTIGNTMMPNSAAIRPLRRPLLIAGAVLVALYALGTGTSLITLAVAQPIAGAAQVLETVLVIVIAIDLIVVAVLGTVEAVIERVTKNSATFQNGKLVALTRDQVIAQREQQRTRAARQTEREQKAHDSRETGAPTIYRMPFPLPGAPPREGIESYISKR